MVKGLIVDGVQEMLTAMQRVGLGSAASTTFLLGRTDADRNLVATRHSSLLHDGITGVPFRRPKENTRLGEVYNKAQMLNPNDHAYCKERGKGCSICNAEGNDLIRRNIWSRSSHRAPKSPIPS